MFIDSTEKGREGGVEKEREKRHDRLLPTHAPTRDRTHNQGMCPDWELNLQPFGAWDNVPTN